MARKTGTNKVKKPKEICRCGCGKKVTTQTQRNHIKGKAGPLVKAHHAARRLATLGLSPGRAKQRILQSPVLSPPAKRREKRAVRVHNNPEMEVDIAGTDGQERAPDAPDDDTLPQFFPEAPGMDPHPDEPMPATPTNSPGSPMQKIAPAPELYDADAATAFREATGAAREGVWSNGHRVLVEEEPEDDADAAMYMDGDLEDEDGFWGDEEEHYDEYEWLYGLPAGDILDEDMERELAEFGTSPS